MLQEREPLGLEEVLSKKSDTLSDFERRQRLSELREYASLFVEEVCNGYQMDAVVIPMENGDQGVEVLDIYLSRANGIYEIGLNHPFFREFIKFRQREDESEAVFFEVIPKERGKNPKMLFNYELHSDGVFNGFLRIFSVVLEVAQKALEEYEAEMEE